MIKEKIGWIRLELIWNRNLLEGIWKKNLLLPLWSNHLKNLRWKTKTSSSISSRTWGLIRLDLQLFWTLRLNLEEIIMLHVQEFTKSIKNLLETHQSIRMPNFIESSYSMIINGRSQVGIISQISCVTVKQWEEVSIWIYQVQQILLIQFGKIMWSLEPYS